MAGKRGRSGRIGVTSAIGVQNKLLDLGIFGPTHSREFGPFGILGPTYFLVGFITNRGGGLSKRTPGSAIPSSRGPSAHRPMMIRYSARDIGAIRSGETCESRMPLGRVPTTLEQLAAPKGCVHEPIRSAGARDWPLETLRKGCERPSRRAPTRPPPQRRFHKNNA